MYLPAYVVRLLCGALFGHLLVIIIFLVYYISKQRYIYNRLTQITELLRIQTGAMINTNDSKSFK